MANIRRSKTHVARTKRAIERAIETVGSATELQRLTKWPKTTISSMRARGSCSPDRAIVIERLTGIPRADLCPSFPWGQA